MDCWYATHPDQCGAYAHEDRGTPPLDDDDNELFVPSPELDTLFDDERMESEYLAEFTEEVADLELVLEAIAEEQAERDAQIAGAL
jgi:hypothetical protein